MEVMLEMVAMVAMEAWEVTEETVVTEVTLAESLWSMTLWRTAGSRL